MSDGHWLIRHRGGATTRVFGVVEVDHPPGHPHKRRLRMTHARPSAGRVDRWVQSCPLDDVLQWGRVESPDSDAFLVADDVDEPPAAAAAAIADYLPATPGQRVLAELLAAVRERMTDLVPAGALDDGTGTQAQLWAAEMAARDLVSVVQCGKATWAHHIAASVGLVYAAETDADLQRELTTTAALLMIWGGVVARRSTTGGTDADRRG